MNKIKQLQNLISESENIVFLGGAGVSTESGIPDFRSEGGIYRTIEKYGAKPEIILSRTYFNEQTDGFFDFYKNEMIHETCKPNEAHKALASLEKKKKLLAVITQNIDGLHQMAGSEKVLELHGSIYRNYCMDCQRAYELSHIIASEGIPRCSDCGGIIKPDVVLYEEGLDEDVLSQSVDALSKADLLIIGGTSLNVYPAASLIQYFRGKAIVLINHGETPYDDRADLVIREDIGSVLSRTQ